jgi:hypothetical protein
MKKNKFYYKDGTVSSMYSYKKDLHRTDGPAAVYNNGDKYWYVDGRQHRTDGPAIEYGNGPRSWRVDGRYYDEEDFNKLIEEVRQLPKVLRLIDPREWVRQYEG